MARHVIEAGGAPFIDVFDIEVGDRIAERVLDGLRACDELVALLTPWSVDRNWVWAEISAAWALGKRFSCVAYGVSLDDISKKHGGLAFVSDTNIIALDDFDDYISQMSARVKAKVNQ